MRFDISTNFESDVFYYCLPNQFNMQLSLEQIQGNIQNLDLNNNKSLSYAQKNQINLIQNQGTGKIVLYNDVNKPITPNLSLLTDFFNKSSSHGNIK